MTKQQQLIEYITQDVISFIMEDTSVDMDVAMHRFYMSEAYDKLLDQETGLYLESAAFVYDLFKTECAKGAFIQTEI
jgi:GR25 family glycosyltransferase involved in LPS biosynthesis